MGALRCEPYVGGRKEALDNGLQLLPVGTQGGGVADGIVNHHVPRLTNALELGSELRERRVLEHRQGVECDLVVTLPPHSVPCCCEHDPRNLTSCVVRPREGAFVTQPSDARVPVRRHGSCPQADNLAIVECRGLKPVVVEEELDPLRGSHAAIRRRAPGLPTTQCLGPAMTRFRNGLPLRSRSLNSAATLRESLS